MPAHRPTRRPTAAVYAALAAAPGAGRPTDLTQTPPPKGGRPLLLTGRPKAAPFGQLLRSLPWTRG